VRFRAGAERDQPGAVFHPDPGAALGLSGGVPAPGYLMERSYAVWALGPKAELRWVWGKYTDGGPEWDIDADASIVCSHRVVPAEPQLGVQAGPYRVPPQLGKPADVGLRPVVVAEVLEGVTAPQREGVRQDLAAGVQLATGTQPPAIGGDAFEAVGVDVVRPGAQHVTLRAVDDGGTAQHAARARRRRSPRRAASVLILRALIVRGSAVAVRSDEFFRIVDALVDVDGATGQNYTSFSVRGKRFGYYWPGTQTVGLKQTLSEQRALVSERPDVFEEQFTAGGFGWVVVYLAGIELDELSELVFEAWRLSAPDQLIAEVPDPAQSTRRARSGP